MGDDSRIPDYEAVLADLKNVREHGIGRLRQLTLPALQEASRATGHSEGGGATPAALRALLTDAVDRLGGGTMQDCAEYSLGLAPDTALWTAARRRAEAARVWGSHPDTFRKTTERDILGQIAEAILDLAHTARMRETKLAMEARHPADSRLAVQWVTRFEAYYRIWTPVYALAADLEAALATRKEPAGPHAPWDPDGREGTGPWDPEDEADGYALYALYHYASYQLELKRFMSTHGGLWLASSRDNEQAIADAIYEVGWHNSLNEEQDAWLRRHLADSAHQELDHFKRLILATSVGESIYREWTAWMRLCDCSNPEALEKACQVHACISAAHRYCELIDDEWDRIADWYAPGSARPRPTPPQTLYSDRMNR